MARIRITRNFKLESIIREAVPPQLLRQEGERIAGRIRSRTLSGLDENNKTFAAYQSGRKERVDLHDTGQMLVQDLGVIKVLKTFVGLGFRTQRSEDIAEKHETGAGTLPVRRFMGVPTAWINDLVDTVKRGLRL